VDTNYHHAPIHMEMIEEIEGLDGARELVAELRGRTELLDRVTAPEEMPGR
jgi:hypothetical protein